MNFKVKAMPQPTFRGTLWKLQLMPTFISPNVLEVILPQEEEATAASKIITVIQAYLKNLELAPGKETIGQALSILPTHST